MHFDESDQGRCPGSTSRLGARLSHRHTTRRDEPHLRRASAVLLDRVHDRSRLRLLPDIRKRRGVGRLASASAWLAAIQTGAQISVPRMESGIFCVPKELPRSALN